MKKVRGHGFVCLQIFGWFLTEQKNLPQPKLLPGSWTEFLLLLNRLPGIIQQGEFCFSAFLTQYRSDHRHLMSVQPADRPWSYERIGSSLPFLTWRIIRSIVNAQFSPDKLGYWIHDLYRHRFSVNSMTLMTRLTTCPRMWPS